MKFTPQAYARAYISTTRSLSGRELTQVATRFWELIWRHKRFAWRKQILLQVAKLEQMESGKIAVDVQAARLLDPATLSKLRRGLEERLDKKVDLKVSVKPHLLSGVVVTVGDERFDASLKGKLDNLYQVLSGDVE